MYCQMKNEYYATICPYAYHRTTTFDYRARGNRRDIAFEFEWAVGLTTRRDYRE